MKKFLILLLCLLMLSSCASQRYGSNKDRNARKGLMLLETNEIGRNKPFKYSKVKAKKILAKKIKKEQKRRK